jgi:fructose-bisphosphate aldolase class II
MALISLRQVLDHAAEHGYGVPAFNVNNLEQIQAIMEAAQETDSPVILQASAGARKYAGEAYLRHMMLAAVEATPTFRLWCIRTMAPPPRCASSRSARASPA